MSVGNPFSPTVTTITTPGTSTVNVPAGATYVFAECIAGGNHGQDGGTGGGGGSYASITQSVLGLATVYVQCGAGGAVSSAVGTDSFVKQTNSGGAIIAFAAAGLSCAAGGLASGCTGSVKNSGGDSTGTRVGGGGAGGPTGAGSGNTTQTGGAGGGGSAGAGGNGDAVGSNSTAGNNYGGGGGAGVGESKAGAGGAVKLSWT